MHSFSTLMRFILRSGKRIAVFVLGAALLTVGLIMFVTPGPGIVLVVAGLAVLATEFAWAEHLLDKAKKQAARAGQSAQKVPGVAAITERAGRLVPGRWRRATTVGVVVTEQTVDGSRVTRTTVLSESITEIDVAEGEPMADAPADARIDTHPIPTTSSTPHDEPGPPGPGTPGAGGPD